MFFEKNSATLAKGTFAFLLPVCSIQVRVFLCNHLYFHTPSEPPLFKGDSEDVKNKIRND